MLIAFSLNSENVFPSLWFSWLLMKNPLFSPESVTFFLAAFMSFYFFFAFRFQKFKYGTLVWFSLGLSCSWFPQCLRSVGLCLLPALGSRQP